MHKQLKYFKDIFFKLNDKTFSNLALIDFEKKVFELFYGRLS